MVEPTGLPRATTGELRSARRLSSRKFRLADGLFLAEGRQAVREAIRPGAGGTQPSAIALIVADSAYAAQIDLLDEARSAGVDVLAATDKDVASLSDTMTPQGLIAICESVDTTLPLALAGDPRLVVICAQVRDPGNAGTVIRCADAFGADAVILTNDSVELGNPKLVRASVGSVFHLPIVTGVDLAEAVEYCRERGLRICAADGGGQLLTEVDLSAPTAWLMGNEAWGLPAEHKALADDVVGVPMWGQAESLNLATAAAVCLYTTAAAQQN
ncbi:MAG: TrmH family RNA methyltransferase [Propionibacteriaceae bacterium]